ncbi:hypothetical protein [Mucilaginibacter sp. SP1R1]|uniref:hypothetical protein n=1 Tax=Mucilaginibacter sp. SP1R1 TaxID=2723091 RepID=UPI00161FE520|nr:hypothetical protein [Mucilaginibacter sp. SP1R1]MBB6151656.1 hypothetical protein [Mucilaginibacter sp. SP1R1]
MKYLLFPSLGKEEVGVYKVEKICMLHKPLPAVAHQAAAPLPWERIYFLIVMGLYHIIHCRPIHGTDSSRYQEALAKIIEQITKQSLCDSFPGEGEVGV